jgi:thioredoxin 1
MNTKVRVAIVAAVAAVVAGIVIAKVRQRPAAAPGDGTHVSVAGLPRLVDVGAGQCIPCKLMAPLLEDLKKEYAGRLQVDVFDLGVTPGAQKTYRVERIPTQIFYDASGQERFRHEGFMSKADILAKWKELGVDLAGSAAPPTFERLAPAAPDTRPAAAICYMCDGDIDPHTSVVVRTEKGDVHLCGPHCYFIMYSCLTEDKAGFEAKVSVTDAASGALVPALQATYLVALDEQTARPSIYAYATREAATAARQSSGGSLLSFAALRESELSHRCGFCDRACYPQDAAQVLIDGVYTWGCCSHCALGVAARTGKDIEVRERDRLTGEPVVVRTVDGSVASLEPATAVAWFGQRRKPDGTWASAGCFHQGFFRTADNLKKWVEQNPRETGRLISIQQALTDKIKLTPQQIAKACKIGECAPK